MRIVENPRALEKVVLISFFSAVLLVTPYSVTDPINLPKMLVIGIFGFICLGFLLQNQIIRQMRTEWYLPLLSLLFILHSLIVFIFSGRNLNEGFYGISGRNTGLLTYFSFIFVCMAASIVSGVKFLNNFLLVFLIVGCLLLLYGFFQYKGLEPFPYVNAYANNVFGTFGNPNFQSAFIGIFGSIVFALCFDSSLSKFKRAIMAILVLLSVLEIFLTNSWQGFFNFAAGLGVAVTLVFFRMNKPKIAFTLLGLGVLGASITAFGLLNIGPLASTLEKASLTARRFYWEAAINLMFKHPLIGVGFDGYGDWYRRGRSNNAFSQNVNLVSDSSHSVPLDIGASGGFPLLLLYFLLICLVIVSIIRIVRNNSKLSIPFIAIVAAWVSYQAQSLISINQIGLGIAGWTLSGLIIGFASKESEDIETKNANPLGQKSRNKALNFTGPIIGLTVGALISLPPFIAANKFYEGLKSSDARIINTNAYLKPLEPRRMVMSASILEQNNFHKEALEITRFATRNFPDCYAAWTLLSSLKDASESDKTYAKSELERLDPNIVN